MPLPRLPPKHLNLFGFGVSEKLRRDRSAKLSDYLEALYKGVCPPVCWEGLGPRWYRPPPRRVRTLQANCPSPPKTSSLSFSA